VIALGGECRRHRRALEDFVERAERGPETAAALEHVERCDACERTMTELALTVAALRRSMRDVRLAPVPVVAPSRIVALTVRRRHSPWSWRFQLGSILTGAAIAAVVVAPRFGFVERQAGHEPAPAHAAVTATWRLAESRLAAAPDRPSVAAVSAVPPRYPEGLSRPWKEVYPPDATPREFEPL
jgi:predicted anti-sigma-YlaC factor YlaD